MNSNIYRVFTNKELTRGKGICHSDVSMNRQSRLGDIYFALSIFRLQLKLKLLLLQILGFSVPQNSRHFMMFTWSNRLALNNVKTALQVHKKTHKAQRARYRRYNIAVPLIIFNNFFSKESKLFLSCFLPQFQNESWCTTFQVEVKRR